MKTPEIGNIHFNTGERTPALIRRGGVFETAALFEGCGASNSQLLQKSYPSGYGQDRPVRAINTFDGIERTP